MGKTTRKSGIFGYNSGVIAPQISIFASRSGCNFVVKFRTEDRHYGISHLGINFRLFYKSVKADVDKSLSTREGFVVSVAFDPISLLRLLLHYLSRPLLVSFPETNLPLHRIQVRLLLS